MTISWPTFENDIVRFTEIGAEMIGALVHSVPKIEHVPSSIEQFSPSFGSFGQHAKRCRRDLIIAIRVRVARHHVRRERLKHVSII